MSPQQLAQDTCRVTAWCNVIGWGVFFFFFFLGTMHQVADSSTSGPKFSVTLLFFLFGGSVVLGGGSIWLGRSDCPMKPRYFQSYLIQWAELWTASASKCGVRAVHLPIGLGSLCLLSHPRCLGGFLPAHKAVFPVSRYSDQESCKTAVVVWDICLFWSPGAQEHDATDVCCPWSAQ